jgi:hypothetical protein
MKIVINRAQILSQLRANIVAIMSMIVALTGMAYNTWRNEKTEINHRFASPRSRRSAELAKRRSSWNTALPEKPSARRSVQGYGRMIYIRDSRRSCRRRPRRRPERLWAAWRTMSRASKTNDEAMVKITDELQLLR